MKKIPLRRGGQTEDIANVCLFLASDLSSYVKRSGYSDRRWYEHVISRQRFVDKTCR